MKRIHLVVAEIVRVGLQYCAQVSFFFASQLLCIIILDELFTSSCLRFRLESIGSISKDLSYDTLNGGNMQVEENNLTSTKIEE